MKRLLLLLAIACVGLASCSETLSAEDKKLEEIQKKFDFSEVDIENIQDIREETNFSTSDLTVFTGTIDDCAWIGVFDSQSGSLKCQYTDVDHPTSYFAYGEEYKYNVAQILGVYFGGNKIVMVIQYVASENQTYRSDLIATDGNKSYRYVIDEDFQFKSASMMKWTNRAACIVLGGFGNSIIIYDIDNDLVMCHLDNDAWGIGSYFYYLINYKTDAQYTRYALIISKTNLLHFWTIYLDATQLAIEAFQCTYNSAVMINEKIQFFDPYTGDSSKTPRYSVEYQTRTDDYISAIVTQTEYDGTVTTKTVDIRLIDDDLKVEVQ